MRQKTAGLALAALFATGLAACTVQQTEEGSPPEIEPGEAPAYDVQPADVEVNWDTAQVRVPDVDLEPRDDTAADPAVR